MTEAKGSPTKALFESLTKLYKQGQLLLADSDRLMEARGWIPRHSNAIAELSYSMNAPQRWFARWAMRFYTPEATEAKELPIDRILFVSIHFASDVNSDVDEPLVCAGRLMYEKPMTDEEAGQTYDYWMCKYWFFGKPHDTLEGWRKTGQSQWYENLKGSETFAVPLYDITCSDKLKELVIDRLLAVAEMEKGNV